MPRRPILMLALLVILSGALRATAQPSKPELGTIVARIEALAPELWRMSDWMHDNPESGHQETKAVALLSEYLTKHGFTVESGLGGFPTAFKASFKGNNGPPHLAFMVEYDALRGKEGTAFHGCQHNMQGPAGIGAAIALAEHLQATARPGSVYVIGAPAEEIPPPVKRLMFERSAFDGLDFITRSHSASATREPEAGIGGCCNVPINSIKFIFKGKATSANIQVGKLPPIRDRHSALEGILEFFRQVEVLRGLVRPETIIQGVILEGGEAMNVFPERTVADFAIRYTGGRGYLEEVTEMVATAARSAAKLTGTEVEVDVYGRYEKGISLSTLHSRAFGYARTYGATNVVETKSEPSGYDETGIVSAHVPGLGVSVQSAPAGTPGHSYENAAASKADIGHGALVIAAKVMASVMYDLLTDEAYREAVRAEHAKWRAVWLEGIGAAPPPRAPR